MLTSSWGSWSTTTTLMGQTNKVRNAECGMRSVKVGDSSHELQHPEPLRILPVSTQPHPAVAAAPHELPRPADPAGKHLVERRQRLDRKSTRLNSSHEWISYAVFCLKKKKNK